MSCDLRYPNEAGRSGNEAINDSGDQTYFRAEGERCTAGDETNPSLVYYDVLFPSTSDMLRTSPLSGMTQSTADRDGLEVRSLV